MDKQGKKIFIRSFDYQRTNNDEITIFDSTGLTIQDIAISNIIYRKATKSKKGKYISFLREKAKMSTFPFISMGNR